jgi:hypothetical protein
MRNKPASVARAKTKRAQSDVRIEGADLHHSNAVLVNSGVGQVLTRQSVQAVVEQNVNVEEKLHDAVQELEVVSELLDVTEAKSAEDDDQTMAGRRSGEGLTSVIEQMSASARRKARRELDFSDSLAPTPAAED